uniref:Uncharacterized protein n=1 Tax=Solanum lycopersicum TaxID=4081 RepID=A0A3Q7EAH1_SOLLC
MEKKKLQMKSLNLAKLGTFNLVVSISRREGTMEAGTFLRALNPFKFRAKFSGSYTTRCSSSSSSIKIPTGAGKEMGRRAYDGLLLDAANTLLQLSKPVEETYAGIGKKYGIYYKKYSRRLFNNLWDDSKEERMPVLIVESYGVWVDLVDFLKAKGLIEGIETEDCEGEITRLIGGMKNKDCQGRVDVGGIEEGGSGGNEEIGGGED